MSYSKGWEDFLKGEAVDPNELEPVPKAPPGILSPDGFGDEAWGAYGEQGIPPNLGGPALIIVSSGPIPIGFPLFGGELPSVQPVSIRQSLADQDLKEFVAYVSGSEVEGYPRHKHRRKSAPAPWLGTIAAWILAAAIAYAFWRS